MRRLSLVKRLTTMTLLVALFALGALTVVTPAAADAQDRAEAAVALAVSPANDEGFRTLAVALDPGVATGLAGLDGYITYDADQVTILSCAVSEAGACNPDGETVRYSVFNLSSLRANDQLITIDFVANDGAADSTSFQIVVEHAFNNQVQELTPMPTATLDVDIAEVQRGAVTGEILSAPSQTSLYNMDVCIAHAVTDWQTCTASTGLGAWRIDDIPVGEYVVVVSDPTAEHATESTTVVIPADDIATGVDVWLDLATAGDDPADDPADDEAEDAVDEAESTDTDSTDGAEQPTARELTPFTEIVYEASIAGVVVSFDSAHGVQGVQVCATQPLVLHQSCASTDANGNFALAGLSTGNYWVTVVDPLGQYDDADAELVGVVGDQAVREGVKMVLVSANG